MSPPLPPPPWYTSFFPLSLPSPLIGGPRTIRAIGGVWYRGTTLSGKHCGGGMLSAEGGSNMGPDVQAMITQSALTPGQSTLTSNFPFAIGRILRISWYFNPANFAISGGMRITKELPDLVTLTFLSKPNNPSSLALSSTSL